MEVLLVGEDLNNINDILNSSGNKRQISTAIQKAKTDNRRNLIKSAHPKNYTANNEAASNKRMKTINKGSNGGNIGGNGNQ